MIRALAIVGSVALGVVVLSVGCLVLAVAQYASDVHNEPRVDPRADHPGRNTWNAQGDVES